MSHLKQQVIILYFFIAKALDVYYPNEKKWKLFSRLCLLGGIMCLSNAGYFALGGAAFFAVFLNLKKRRKGKLLIALIPLIIIIFGLFGRYIIVHNNIDLPFLHAFFGVRDVGNIYNYSLDKAMGGRISLNQENLGMMFSNFLGVGMQIPGLNNAGKGFSIASASAPILWFSFTGYIGLALLMIVEYYVFYIARSISLSRFQVYIVQAWLASTLQQLSYGTWTSPLYLILSISVIVLLHPENLIRKVYINKRECELAR